MPGATRRRTLRSGHSIWEGSWGTHVPVGPVARDLTCDVAVVGAGISGALVALALAKRGMQVCVLDRRAPMRGSTTASTALLQFEIDLPLMALAERIGLVPARRAWQRSLAAVDALGRLIEREGIRCGFARRQSLYLAGDAYGHRALRREAQARAAADLPGRFVDSGALAERFEIDRTGAIVSRGSAVANPVQLTAALLRRAVKRGARIHVPADVVEVTPERGGVTLALNSGHEVRASHAVFCTGYELLRAVSLRDHRILSTWAIAAQSSASLPAWLGNTVVWEASDPYLYLRTAGDGTLIAGGEDSDAASAHTSAALMRSKSRHIARNVRALLPGVRLSTTHRWAGAFGASSTGLPIIGGVPGLPRCHVVAGFGGNGITYSVIAADIIRARLSGTRDPDEALYRVQH